MSGKKRPPANPAIRSAASVVFKKELNVWTRASLWTRLAFVIFPCGAYGFYEFVRYNNKKVTYVIQQSNFFKESIDMMVNNSAVQETYGRKVKLLDYNYMTLTGFFPWLRRKYLWMGFTGPQGDGWMRMGLVRNDLAMEEGALATQIWKDLDEETKAITTRALEGSGYELTEGEDGKAAITESFYMVNTEESKPEDVVEIVSNDDEGVSKDATNDTTETHDVDAISQIVEESTKPTVEELSEDEIKANNDAKEKDRAMIQQKIIKEMYPSLPEKFTQSDIRMAQNIRQQQRFSVTFYNELWTLQALSIHSSRLDGKVIVLYDPENVCNTEEYWFDNKYFTLRKPAWLKKPIDRQFAN